MKTSTHPSSSTVAHDPHAFSKAKGHSARATSASATAVPSPHILDLRGSDIGYSLKDELIKGLADGQPRIVPGESPDDAKYAYTRTLDTLCLYSDRGLDIYEKITELKEYYPFPCELEILRKYGAEIVCRMFGEQSEVLTDEYLARTDGGSNGEGGDERRSFEHGPTPAASDGALKQRWGDGAVGINNNGVNGGLSGRSGIAIELGSGSLAKTKHLLQPMARLLQPTAGGRAPFDSIEYKALDVEPQSLVTTLTKLGGIAATYDEGLAHYHSRPSTSNQSKSLLWLGSSIGNFSRPDAVEFLKKIANTVLQPGDTMVIGVDNCADESMIRTGYDDPQGVTRSFIFEGVDHAGRALHGVLDGAGGLASKNFDYISRWNAQIGRHEAYVQCKRDDLVIPLPSSDKSPARKITLKKNEMVRIEVSYKYTHVEALALFNAAGLRLVQQWQDSRRLHSIYLIEKPAFHFPLHASLTVAPAVNPYGLPTLQDWETMWKCWDTITRGIIPHDLLMSKPIPLRHIILFYTGHIPAFAGIHLCRYFEEAPFEPARFADLFERGIDPDVSDPSKINHWHSEVPEKADEWPSLQEITAYQDLVRERIRKVYSAGEGNMTMRLARIMFMIFEHEAMHAETLVYIALQASNSLLPAPGFQKPDFKSLSAFSDRLVAAEGDIRRQIVSFAATSVVLGHNDAEVDDADAKYDPSHEFGWDTENPRREVDVPAFRIAALPVSNGEYLEWLQATNQVSSAEMVPSSWASSSTGPATFSVKTLYGEIPFDFAKHWPCSASAIQLQAFAKAKGGRLPTQAEMAVFQRQSPVDSATGNVGFQNLHPTPPVAPHLQRDGSIGFGSDGGVWMWTSTVLDAHPGFAPSTIYPGYSSDFHDGTHLVVVGGSYVTPPRLARRTFVNFYQAKYPIAIRDSVLAISSPTQRPKRRHAPPLSLHITPRSEMTVEFISLTPANAADELNPTGGSGVDPEYIVRHSRALDDYGFNYTLIPYGSGGPDPFTIGATIIAATKNIKVIIALRLNTIYPTVAAKALATLDHLSKGRVVVHFIAGGSDAEQAKEGDFLNKEERYERLEEYIRILHKAWSSSVPFDHEGKHYQFKNFLASVRPAGGKIPVSVGGSSPEAYRVGGSLADIFGLWGEPLKETKEQIDRIYAEAAKAGRTDRPRIWVTFRPIIGATEDVAWAKAHKTLEALERNSHAGIYGVVSAKGATKDAEPQNVGSQRLLEIAKRGEVQDRALWYPTVTATGARGASTALVGTPEVVADSILDYVKLGAELISIRGYDNLGDAIDYGRFILPKVRDGLKAIGKEQ
ncbi:hypothetical protein RQP46_004828 [Phenoliferia psychrophenolica]